MNMTWKVKYKNENIWGLTARLLVTLSAGFNLRVSSMQRYIIILICLIGSSIIFYLLSKILIRLKIKNANYLGLLTSVIFFYNNNFVLFLYFEPHNNITRNTSPKIVDGKIEKGNLNKLMRNTFIKSIDLFSHIKNNNIFKILNLAEKNNFNIWIVGGALRDFFLKKSINDFDFVYDINPLELVEILKTNKLDFISSYMNFGVIIIKFNNKKYTLTSLREDFKQDGRYTKVDM